MPRKETLATLEHFTVEPVSDDDVIDILADRLQETTSDVAIALAIFGGAPKAIGSFLQERRGCCL